MSIVMPSKPRVAIVFVIMFLFLIGLAYGLKSAPDSLPDDVFIHIPGLAGSDDMPPVRFSHDRHTEMVSGIACAKCHLKKDDDLVFKFMRIADSSPAADRDIYHDNCIDCHVQTVADKKPAGPITGDCRGCHNPNLPVGQSRQPVEFDRSLHYRHETAKSILPVGADETRNCSACHHSTDAKNEKIFYKKDDEGACRYCHLPIPVDKQVRSLQAASHDSCVQCHQKLADQRQHAGPVTCAGCHARGWRQLFEVKLNVPRLKRNQPDQILMAQWLRESADKVRQPIEPVAFDHLAHENAIDRCSRCHHKALTNCRECHTPSGKLEGGFVQLSQAMHDPAADQSCIGCHDRQTQQAACVGCHAAMPQKTFAKTDCSACHQAALPADVALPLSAAEQKRLAAAAIDARAKGRQRAPDEKIPETVTIGVIADQFQPVVLPHRRIVNTLNRRIEANPLTRRFHGSAETLCAGCHHHSPASVNPPACISCHGPARRDAAGGQPGMGLMAAYHGQCIRCHQEMGILKPAANDCASCHPEKTRQSDMSSQSKLQGVE
jgi:hypothetical protein